MPHIEIMKFWSKSLVPNEYASRSAHSDVICYVGMAGLREGEGAARAAGLQARVGPHRPRHVAGRQPTQQLGRIPQAW